MTDMVLGKNQSVGGNDHTGGVRFVRCRTTALRCRFHGNDTGRRLLRRRLGIVRAMWLPTWKNEGYCEYVAGEPSFGVSNGIKLLANGQSHPNPSFQYLEYWLAVRQALDVNGLSLDELMSLDIRAEPLVKQAAESFGSQTAGDKVQP